MQVSPIYSHQLTRFSNPLVSAPSWKLSHTNDSLPDSPRYSADLRRKPSTKTCIWKTPDATGFTVAV